MLKAPLYKKDSKGKHRVWQVEINDENPAQYRTIAGLFDGKKVTSEWTTVEGKNIGRSNETTPAQQCVLEVESLYRSKQDRHYVYELDDVREMGDRAYFEPMLAKSYKDLNDKKKAKLWEGRVFVQPKLDGLRGPTSKKGTFSRKGKEFLPARFFQEILQPLWDVYPDVVLDGELYNHDFHDDFGEIVSIFRNDAKTEDERQKARELGQLWVYDIFIPRNEDMVFSDRYAFLQDVVKIINHPSIVLVPTFEIKTESDLQVKNEEFHALGFLEGTIIRQNKPYQHKRTEDVLKYKNFDEDEFEVLKYIEGSGNWGGHVKAVELGLPNGNTSEAGVRGTMPFLKDLWQRVQRGEHPYKMVTTQYQGYTPDGKLRIATVKDWHVDQRVD